MSRSQVLSFVEKIESSPELIEEVKPMNLQEVFLMAMQDGYQITTQDWNDYIVEKVRAASVELSDAELENVAAGVGVSEMPASSIIVC
ncbi:MAG: Nif11-like leader peptide family RiPP precursor [Anaerolineales bacterium]|nr:Nif11-like leader peptide family natural product precursor [Chloroflexota bacterium]MBL6982844.1 Nif11-like leader peptide family RiPP precursor [Anaerolineales bacterium]